MTASFLGVDVAGGRNTWVCRLRADTGSLRLVESPRAAALSEIVTSAQSEDILAVAIDAQLTWCISQEMGFRQADTELRSLLPANLRDTVASQNSLMAVPVRGRQLAECLSPFIGTIVETHPRACLALTLPDLREAIKAYKKDARHCATVAHAWCLAFGIVRLEDSVFPCDGAVDAFVCATVAALYHRTPERLHRLGHSGPAMRGHGPFVVTRL